jgi:hypothetical protein
MKQPRKLHEVQQEYKETVVGLCISCGKPTSGWYGRWGDVGTCGKKCETIQRESVAEKRTLDYTAYITKHNL